MFTISSLRRRLRVLATYDFSPKFSAKVRKVVLSPLGVLILAILMAVLCGLVLHPRVFVLAGGLSFVLALGVVWPWVVKRAIRADLWFVEDRVIENEKAQTVVELTNHLPCPMWNLSVWESSSALPIRLPTLRARCRSQCGWEFTPTVRGVYPVQLPSVGTGFPFGIWNARRNVRVKSNLIVWPLVLPVGPVPSSDGSDVVEGNVTRNKVGSSGDVLGVRPYRRGDSPRRIHWAQSARHDRLIVCELQSNSRPVVTILLDTDPKVYTQGEQGSREWAIRTVASFAKGWLELGAQIGVVWENFTFAPQSGNDQAERILDALATIPETGVPLTETIQQSRSRIIPNSVVIVVTSDLGYEKYLAETGRSTSEFRWVIIANKGFDENNIDPQTIVPAFPCWLFLPNRTDLPSQLRYGTTEATHGT